MGRDGASCDLCLLPGQETGEQRQEFVTAVLASGSFYSQQSINVTVNDGECLRPDFALHLGREDGRGVFSSHVLPQARWLAGSTLRRE